MRFYKYARNQYLGDSLNNFVYEESIWIIFICASMSNKMECYMFKTRRVRKINPILNFLNWNLLLVYFFYLIFVQTYVNIFQIKLLYIFLLYSVNATIRILNNCSLWVRYPSLERNYYLWLDTLVVK